MLRCHPAFASFFSLTQETHCCLRLNNGRTRSIQRDTTHQLGYESSPAGGICSSRIYNRHRRMTRPWCKPIPTSPSFEGGLEVALVHSPCPGSRMSTPLWLLSFCGAKISSISANAQPCVGEPPQTACVDHCMMGSGILLLVE